MGDGRSRDAEDQSWTDVADALPDMVEAVPVRHGMVLGGRYTIERIIGRGGSGVVVRAHDRDLKEVVAIKIVRAELAGQHQWATRLAREVKLARQIHHPHVCRVFDFQQAESRAFLVMELAEKGALREEIKSGALVARPLGERIADARAVASALDAIHRAGILHRDLTPQNLLRMGDGRVAVSDFGLATDVSEGTSSVHGGTIAYMAPELLRGGRSSFASDIWALGVVMHEIVFGEKPRWGSAAGAQMLPPALRRKLTREERAVFETCRACAAPEPRHRIATAAEAGRRLTQRWGWRMRRLRALHRPLMLAGALTLVAAAAVGVLRVRQRPLEGRTSATHESPLIVPTGEPADWTDVSTVLAEVPERITCTRLLPDQRTIRFVWGSPPRAEDIDIVTRKRVPSPLVPAAYAEGCPDLSPDGKRLVYQGHTADGRAFAFLSERPDGKDAVPVVQTAEPTMLSEPTWLFDGQTLAFDIDAKHMGLFTTMASRTTVLPEVARRPYVTSFRFVIRKFIFVATLFEAMETLETEFTGIAMPAMEEKVRFRVPESALDLRSSGTLLYYTNRSADSFSVLTEVDVSNGRARRAGSVRKQFIRNPTFAASGLTFVSVRVTTTLVARRSDGATRRSSSEDRIYSAAPCAQDIVVSRQNGGRSIIERLDAETRLVATLTEGPGDSNPVCSPDGRVLFYLRYKGWNSIMRCDQGGCRSILDRLALSLSISPDGRRLAFVAFDNRGAIVQLMDPDGSRIRELTETETGCQVGWTSTKTLWVSRRRDGRIVWVEINTESGRETGRSVPGSRDCSDGRPDPESPVQPNLRIVYDQTSQLRLLGKQYLTAH